MSFGETRTSYVHANIRTQRVLIVKKRSCRCCTENELNAQTHGESAAGGSGTIITLDVVDGLHFDLFPLEKKYK